MDSRLRGNDIILNLMGAIPLRCTLHFIYFFVA
jgi:hypothetical protein